MFCIRYLKHLCIQTITMETYHWLRPLHRWSLRMDGRVISYCVNSPETRLFVRKHIRANNIIIIKVPHHWVFVSGIHRSQVDPYRKKQWIGSLSHGLKPSCCWMSHQSSCLRTMVNPTRLRPLSAWVLLDFLCTRDLVSTWREGRSGLCKRRVDRMYSCLFGLTYQDLKNISREIKLYTKG